MLGNDNARAQCTSVTYVLRASLPSKGDSVNRYFDNQASYHSIAQANLESGTTWAGVCCWGPQTRTIYLATLYTCTSKDHAFFIILVHFISHTKLRFLKLTRNFLLSLLFLRKSCWCHKCEPLIANVHYPSKASGPERHAPCLIVYPT